MGVSWLSAMVEMVVVSSSSLEGVLGVGSCCAEGVEVVVVVVVGVNIHDGEEGNVTICDFEGCDSVARRGSWSESGEGK